VISMSMAQIGTLNNLSLVVAGRLKTGGMMSETIDKAETVVFGVSKMLSETPQRTESVLITNT